MKRVLIADDNRANLKILLQFFDFFGTNAELEITTVSTGRDALATALAKRPDLILMDINMETPFAGLDATREIRKQITDTRVNIWAVTSQAMKAHDDEESDEQKCLNAGCDRYITKPFNQKELLLSLSELLGIPIPERFRKKMGLG